jgi:hypothetical protein
MHPHMPHNPGPHAVLGDRVVEFVAGLRVDIQDLPKPRGA